MTYEGKLNVIEYTDEEFTKEVFEELGKMKLSFVPLYNFKTLEIFTFEFNNATKSYKLIERYLPFKFNRAKFSPLACAIFIKAFNEYKMEHYNY